VSRAPEPPEDDGRAPRPVQTRVSFRFRIKGRKYRMDLLKEKALQYHCLDGVPGKVSVLPTKPCQTADDLSLAYTPVWRSGAGDRRGFRRGRTVTTPPMETWSPSSRTERPSSARRPGCAGLQAGDGGQGGSCSSVSPTSMSFDIELDVTDPWQYHRNRKGVEPTFAGESRGHQGPECFEIEQRSSRCATSRSSMTTSMVPASLPPRVD
jgi:malate dehydrogenase (oxaloacetate-decarboxylating)(NADP+)